MTLFRDREFLHKLVRSRVGVCTIWAGASHLPEGDLRIAHAFKRGTVESEHRVPKGRLNHPPKNGKMTRWITCAGFDRPFGTCRLANLTPAVNCRAILDSPSGRELQQQVRAACPGSIVAQDAQPAVSRVANLRALEPNGTSVGSYDVRRLAVGETADRAVCATRAAT